MFCTCKSVFIIIIIIDFLINFDTPPAHVMGNNESNWNGLISELSAMAALIQRFCSPTSVFLLSTFVADTQAGAEK